MKGKINTLLDKTKTLITSGVALKSEEHTLCKQKVILDEEAEMNERTPQVYICE